MLNRQAGREDMGSGREEKWELKSGTQPRSLTREKHVEVRVPHGGGPLQWRKVSGESNGWCPAPQSVWSVVRQHQRHPGLGRKLRISGPAPDLLDQEVHFTRTPNWRAG